MIILCQSIGCVQRTQQLNERFINVYFPTSNTNNTMWHNGLFLLFVFVKQRWHDHYVALCRLLEGTIYFSRSKMLIEWSKRIHQ